MVLDQVRHGIGGHLSGHARGFVTFFEYQRVALRTQCDCSVVYPQAHRRELLVSDATTSQRAVFRDCLGQQRIEYFVTFDIANILLESGAAINRHGNLLVAFLLYPNRASSQHRTATFEPLSQHRRETLTVMTSIAERCLVELSTLEIEVNVGFPGEADPAMYL